MMDRPPQLSNSVETQFGSAKPVRHFATADALDEWLAENHDSATVLWVQIFKKGSGAETVDWNDCVIACLTWGWIDGQKKSVDEASYLQRITPRRDQSNWSQRNTMLAETLIGEGRMQPSGYAKVLVARKNGRWDSAYAGSANMEIPQDFLDELAQNQIAHARFTTLSRARRFEIYQNLQSARTNATRLRKISLFVAELSEEEEKTSSNEKGSSR